MLSLTTRSEMETLNVPINWVADYASGIADACTMGDDDSVGVVKGLLFDINRSWNIMVVRDAC